MTEPTPTQAQDPQARRRCGAKTRKGTPCPNAPVDGMTRCRMHGGTQPVGPLSPNWKTGRYSAHLPANLRDVAARQEADTNRLDLSAHLGLLEALIVRSLDELDAEGGGAIWKDLREKFRQYDREQAKGKEANVGLLAQYFREARDLVNRGHADYRARVELRDTLDQYRRTAATEVKRHETAQTMVHAEQVMAYFGQLGQIIARHVTDAKARVAISQEIARILGPVP